MVSKRVHDGFLAVVVDGMRLFCGIYYSVLDRSEKAYRLELNFYTGLGVREVPFYCYPISHSIFICVSPYLLRLFKTVTGYLSGFKVIRLQWLKKSFHGSCDVPNASSLSMA